MQVNVLNEDGETIVGDTLASVFKMEKSTVQDFTKIADGVFRLSKNTRTTIIEQPELGGGDERKTVGDFEQGGVTKLVTREGQKVSSLKHPPPPTSRPDFFEKVRRGADSGLRDQRGADSGLRDQG